MGNLVITGGILRNVKWWTAQELAQGNLASGTHDIPAPRSEGNLCRQSKEVDRGLPHSRIPIHPLRGENVHQAPNIAGTLEEQ